MTKTGAYFFRLIAHLLIFEHLSVYQVYLAGNTKVNWD